MTQGSMIYEGHFGLAKNPFGMSPDPAFLYLTAGHREALVGLAYAVLQRKGFAVLTGQTGTGKTTLLRRLQEFVSARTCFVTNPTLSPDEFLEIILLSFGVKDVPGSKAQRLIKLEEFLLQSQSENQGTVLIVDEAQRLKPETLEEIRLLTNLETAQGKLLQILLVGQEELRDLLNREDLRQLKQRIGVRLEIKALPPEEIAAYLRHRWNLAGARRELAFRPDAIDRVAHVSKGIPRVINAVCDNALLLAYAEGASSVSLSHVTDAAADLDLIPRVEYVNGSNGRNGANVFVSQNGAGDKCKETAASELMFKPTMTGSILKLDRYAPDTSDPSWSRRWANRLGFSAKRG